MDEMNKAKQRLAELAAQSAPSDWREKAKYDRENRRWLDMSSTIALKILDALEVKNMTKADLAKAMNISRQQINEIVKGRENLTLKTISEIEAALDIVLVPSSLEQEIL